MAKKSPKKPEPVKARVAKVESPASIKLKLYFPYLLTALFFLLSLIGVLNHEMWRDEYQAWMVATGADSIAGLFQNLKYDGHAGLWPLGLYVLSRFSDAPVLMQLFHIAISTTFIYLFARYSPFPAFQKVLFAFGYFVFFEYNMISRCYGIGVLFAILFCVLYAGRKKNMVWLGLTLFLLANCSIFGIMLAFCFTGILLLDVLLDMKKPNIEKIPFMHLGMFCLFAFGGLLLGYLQVRPEPDNSFPNTYVTGYDPVRMKFALSRLVYSYFSISDFTNIHFWNTNMFISEERKFNILISILLFAVWAISFLRFRLVSLLYAGGTLLLLIFHYYTGLVWHRYAGHLFILLVVCSWLAYYYPEEEFKNKLLNNLSVISNKIRQPFFVLILGMGFIGGTMAWITDMKHPFSTSYQAAEYIKANKLDQYEIVGCTDFIVSPLAAMLRKKIFYPEHQEYGSFMIWDKKRNDTLQFAQTLDAINMLFDKGNKRIILAKGNAISGVNQQTGKSTEWTSGPMTERLNLSLLKSFKPGIVKDEMYYIYSVDEIVKPQ